MSRANAASDALRRLRRAAGLSQEELAARSGVSARTIRTLESGGARRPHRDTVTAVADALGLDGADRAAFAASWRSDRLTMSEMFRSQSPARAMEEQLSRQRERIRDLVVDMSVEVRADRRWGLSRIRRTIEVVAAEGVDHIHWMFSFDPLVVDGAAFVAARCVNVAVTDSFVLPESGAKAFAGDLGRTFEQGERFVLEYEYDYEPAYLSGGRRAAADTEALFASATPMQVLVTDVTFDPRAVPARVWQVSQDSVAGPATVVRELSLGRFGHAQAVVCPVPSGVHGIRWSWD
ncbi:Helix-turn-helix domain-containing protein [Jatrophihabitans endophyticus]|uniref:Helix-turn-helix domain-containing protein n=1 Tax=Jatrophihabitans endophyticus TaxID=1206085 RepID=A0A1M5RFF7_9ACTN|nr:helix-turn-helix transcriptional regulator [Jatrophihabitans endophyticus]SHH25001.1 Helix-turn-helix domain-containing protein [Jatrophihabitans endophyticus]